jgi:BirA family biotin operon repressor/biotin-[acetyl-CoA-carboxylase] ligase
MQQLRVNFVELSDVVNEINSAYLDLLNVGDLTSTNDLMLSYISLNHELNWLNLTKINQLLLKLNYNQCNTNTYNIIILDSVDSTNTYILNNLDNLKDKTCVVTEWQVNGRGRGGKKWVTRIATDLTLSVLYFVPLDVDIKLLPLVVSVAISRLFKSLGLKIKIKWPNDIYMVTPRLFHPEDKICGILVESGNINKNRFVVIGIGVDNVLNMERNLLLCHLLNNLDNIINEYIAFGFMLIRQEWLDNCLHHNKKVNIYQNHNLIDTGVHVDLTGDGILVIRTVNDELRYYNLSSFSLRACL